MKNIHILGAGAMGCLWASYFQKLIHAQKVALTFIVRDANKWKNIHQLSYEPGNIHFPISVCEPHQTQPIQYLIVATKAQQAFEAITSVQHRLSRDCQIVLLQNGMGSQQKIAQAFPHLAIYACSSTEGAFKKQLDSVVHAGQGENHIGPMTATARQTELYSWIPQEKVNWVENIETALWRKLVINAAINPLTVYYHCQNGKLLENADALEHMAKLCQELDLLTEAKKLSITNTFDLAKSVCKSTAKNYSSMYKDAEAGRQTEIEFINGFVVQSCRQMNIPCPYHEQIVDYIASSTTGGQFPPP